MPEPTQAAEVQGDVEQLAMSTLSFQDYVRERMLKRRDAALKAEAQMSVMPEPHPESQREPLPAPRAASHDGQRLPHGRERREPHLRGAAGPCAYPRTPRCLAARLTNPAFLARCIPEQ